MTKFIQYDKVTSEQKEAGVMLITRESDYALRLLRTLRDGAQSRVGELARREMVPQPFAYKIVKKLSAAGMVQVSRGAEGGCRLTADLTQTTLYDLLRAMEEDSNISSCMEAEYACPWRAAHGGCSVHARLGEIQRRLDAQLHAHSLEELLA